MSNLEKMSLGRTHRRGAAAICLVLAGLGLPPTPAAAHDHRPPKASLLADGEKQAGHRVHSLWAKRVDERSCDVMDRTGLVTFPKRIRTGFQEPASIVFKKESMPLEVSLQAWTEIDEEGHPDGEPIPIPAALMPAEGQAAWQIRFAIPPGIEHLYLLAEAYWADEEGCTPAPDLGSQYAAWTFHLHSPN